MAAPAQGASGRVVQGMAPPPPSASGRITGTAAPNDPPTKTASRESLSLAVNERNEPNEMNNVRDDSYSITKGQL